MRVEIEAKPVRAAPVAAVQNISDAPRLISVRLKFSYSQQLIKRSVFNETVRSVFSPKQVKL